MDDLVQHMCAASKKWLDEHNIRIRLIIDEPGNVTCQKKKMTDRNAFAKH